jgi:hypothetical protein
MLGSRGKVEGGWPGTVPEARMRMLRTLPEQLNSAGLSPLEPAELVAMTSAVYAQARQHWQRAVKPSRFAQPLRREADRLQNQSPCSDGPAAARETSRASIEK